MSKHKSNKKSQLTTKRANQLGSSPQAPKAGQHGQN